MFTCIRASTCGGELFFSFHDVHWRTKKSFAKKLPLLLPPHFARCCWQSFRLLDHQYQLCCWLVGLAAFFLPLNFPSSGDELLLLHGGSASRKVGKKSSPSSSLCIFMYFFSCFNFFAISLFVVRSRFGSLNVSYRWIATLRRLGCNLFFAACSFFSLREL